MDQTKILEAYTRLQGFKDNLPKKAKYIQENYIDQYHLILDLLEKTTGHNLSGFRVPDNEINYRSQLPLTSTGEATKTNVRFSPLHILMMKVDAVLSFFTIQLQSDNKKPVGFIPQ